MMVWVISGSVDKARSLLRRFYDVWEGEGALSADFPNRANKKEFQIRRFGTM